MCVCMYCFRDCSTRYTEETMTTTTVIPSHFPATAADARLRRDAALGKSLVQTRSTLSAYE